MRRSENKLNYGARVIRFMCKYQKANFIEMQIITLGNQNMYN